MKMNMNIRILMCMISILTKPHLENTVFIQRPTHTWKDGSALFYHCRKAAHDYIMFFFAPLEAKLHLPQGNMSPRSRVCVYKVWQQ